MQPRTGHQPEFPPPRLQHYVQTHDDVNSCTLPSFPQRSRSLADYFVLHLRKAVTTSKEVSKVTLYGVFDNHFRNDLARCSSLGNRTNLGSGHHHKIGSSVDYTKEKLTSAIGTDQCLNL